MITTDIIKTFIIIYGEQLTTHSYQPLDKFHNLHECHVIEKETEIFIKVVPMHWLEFPIGDVETAAVNPSRHVQLYDPFVLAQVE